MQQNVAAALAVTIAVASALYIASPSGAVENAAGGAVMTPVERVKATAKGQLKNPLSLTPEIVAEGKALYQAKTCGACHGGNGGGIHCPSVINEAWIYGGDDDTIFRLATLGSEQMLSQGYVRGDKEKHAGPMPAFGEAITDETELWKIIIYIRSLKPGAPAN